MDQRSGDDTIAHHFLNLLHAKNPDVITDEMVRCIDGSMICYAEHGMYCHIAIIRLNFRGKIC